MSNLNTRELLTVADLALLFAVSKRTIRRWMNDGCFPRPVHFTRTCVRWRASDIDEYLENCRDSAPARMSG